MGSHRADLAPEPVRLLPGSADYPRDAWYVAATIDEIAEGPLHRWLLGKPVVLFRQDDGTPVALYDRCPHRGYPLSAGKVVDGAIQCGYHGLRFGADGSCVHAPSEGTVPDALAVESYPVVERWQWLWIWMGDQRRADPEEIPDVSDYGIGLEGWHSETSVLLEVAANYLLPFENLLDASHITFLHEGQIDAGDVATRPLKLENENGRIFASRRIENEPQAELTMKTFGFSGTHAHRTIMAQAMPPNLCGIRVVLEPVEESDVDQQVNQLIVAITPQDHTHCLQFTAVTQTFPFFNDTRHEDLRNLLMEDVVAMERIQALTEKIVAETGDDDLPEYGLAADKGAYLARRMFARMIREERGANAERNAA